MPKIFAIIAIVSILVIIGSASFLYWDHQKYGADQPPDKVVKARNACIIMILLCTTILIILSLYPLFRMKSHSVRFMTTLLLIFIVVTICALVIYALYYFSWRYEYNFRNFYFSSYPYDNYSYATRPPKNFPAPTELMQHSVEYSSYIVITCICLVVLMGCISSSSTCLLAILVLR